MTKTQRRVLIKARRQIENGNHQFICLALLDVAHGNAEYAAAQYLREYIMDHLCGCSCFETWFRWRNDAIPTRSFAKAARLRWIDWMLGGDGL